MGNSVMIWKLLGGPHPSIEPIPLDPPPASLDEATRRLPQGGYTTLRTFQGGRVLALSEHFIRLENTARLAFPDAGRSLSLDWQAVREGLRGVVRQVEGEKRVRISLDLTENPGMVYFLTEPLTVPSPDDYRQGVSMITRVMQRANPKAKLTGFVEKASAVRKQVPQGVNEVLMIADNGRALEGLSSNFFGVRDETVFTAGEDVLEGITRAQVLRVIHQHQMQLELKALKASELEGLDEAFITSASRAVLPVTRIDRKPVGSGLPGPITQKIMIGYEKQIEQVLEEI